jgi:hypothetical protein
MGHLTNYGQNAYFWTFWTFSHGGKSRNDTKPVSAGRIESKNRKFLLTPKGPRVFLLKQPPNNPF